MRGSIHNIIKIKPFFYLILFNEILDFGTVWIGKNLIAKKRKKAKEIYTTGNLYLMGHSVMAIGVVFF